MSNACKALVTVWHMVKCLVGHVYVSCFTLSLLEYDSP